MAVDNHLSYYCSDYLWHHLLLLRPRSSKILVNNFLLCCFFVYVIIQLMGTKEAVSFANSTETVASKLLTDLDSVKDPETLRLIPIIGRAIDKTVSLRPELDMFFSFPQEVLKRVREHVNNEIGAPVDARTVVKGLAGTMVIEHEGLNKLNPVEMRCLFDLALGAAAKESWYHGDILDMTAAYGPSKGIALQKYAKEHLEQAEFYKSLQGKLREKASPSRPELRR